MTLRLLSALLVCLHGLQSGEVLSGAESGRTQPSVVPGGSPVTRPNLLFIMADDHGRDAVSCYGGGLISTPHIDRLARDGVRFTHAFACNSICSPSRATLLTGKYNHLCGVQKLSERFDGSQQTFPKLLHRAGYQTAIVGKWHLESEPAGFDFFSVLPGQGRYLDPLFKESGQPWGPNGNKGGVAKQGYVTDLITDTAIQWLKGRRVDQPFCLMVHHKAPHSPHVPAPRHKDLFKDKVFPEPPTLLDEYSGRAPARVADELAWSRLIQQCEPPYAPVKEKFIGEHAQDTRLMYQEYARNYLRMVVALDENVGRLLDYLDTSGLDKNTLVIYTSDNGYFLGEHGFYNKMWMYEESLTLPFLVRLPAAINGVKTGSVSDAMIGMLDVAPTLLDFAGVKIPPDIQGRSIRPLLTDPKAVWRDAFYYHYYGALGAPRDKNWIAFNEIIGIRTATEKLVFYPTMPGERFWEYFDLKADPLEMTNNYARPSEQKSVQVLKSRLRALAAEYQDTEVVKQLESEP